MLDRNEFKMWLYRKSRSPETKHLSVGNPEAREDCPLCRFIKETSNDEPLFDLKGAHIINGSPEVTPMWARKFQELAIEKIKPRKRVIKAKECLEILREIK